MHDLSKNNVKQYLLSEETKNDQDNKVLLHNLEF